MNDDPAAEYARSLYNLIPANYRLYDAQFNPPPLFTLITAVGEQGALLKGNMQALWQDFFLETCQDWVVPYIGALVGANLLAHPIGQSNRLAVRDAIRWHRSRGTPAMLREVAEASSGWSAGLREAFQTVGWSQNVNFVNLERVLTPDIRSPYSLGKLGRAEEPFAHAIDVGIASPLAQSPVMRGMPGIGLPAIPTRGRYNIPNVEVFARRLETFPLKGVTPSPAPIHAALPLFGKAGVGGGDGYWFDPLARDVPLFTNSRPLNSVPTVDGRERNDASAPIRLSDFAHAPWKTFGKDVAVRGYGVLLADDRPPEEKIPAFAPPVPFNFGGAGDGLTLRATDGIRLMRASSFDLGATHFVISAVWVSTGWSPATHSRRHPAPRPFRGERGAEGGVRAGSVTLGALSTRFAATGEAPDYQPGHAASSNGALAITIQSGLPDLWTSAVLPPSPPALFPGAVIAVRAERVGAQHESDGIYVYLPALPVTPFDAVTLYVAADGSTYLDDTLNTPLPLARGRGWTPARASEGQFYPPHPLQSSIIPTREFLTLNRLSGIRIADPSRLGGEHVRIEALVIGVGAPEPIGLYDTAATPPYRSIPGPPPEPSSILLLRYMPVGGDFLPPLEVILTNRAGEALLVYLPEQVSVGPEGVCLVVAEDGSTREYPFENVGRSLLSATLDNLSDLPVRRASAGQVLPIDGIWPLQHRRPVGIDLWSWQDAEGLAIDEIGIDPELGRFAVAEGAPPLADLSVDYVEALTGNVGACTDAFPGYDEAATIIVSQSGDSNADVPVYVSIFEALGVAVDGSVIEIADSRTYEFMSSLIIDNPYLYNGKLTIRAAAGCRPCLTTSDAVVHLPRPRLQRGVVSPPVDIVVQTSLAALTLEHLLVSNIGLQVVSPVERLRIASCSFDPLYSQTPAVVSDGAATSKPGAIEITRCILGGVLATRGVSNVTIADSVIDAPAGVAVSALSEHGLLPPVTLQLERVTVIGTVVCDILNATDCILCDNATVSRQQVGFIRYSRFQRGSVLPLRFMCLPSDGMPGDCTPVFNSVLFGRPDYAQLAFDNPKGLPTASEQGSEIGAFAGVLSTIRLNNLNTKISEFLPVGLDAVVVGST